MILKTVKWFVILLIVLLIAVVIAVNVIDVNRYKPQIENFVSDTYNRKLSIGGDLSLKFFPRVAVALPESTLSEPGAETTAFQLKSASVSVAVMPLLSGRLEADKVQLHGLRANLTRFKDGTTSIDDLIGSSDAGAEEQKTDAPADGSPAIGEFRIGGVELLDAAISVKDEVGGTTLDLSDVNLKTGELADNEETPISCDQPGAQGAGCT
jgi:AsmA protein